MVVFKKNSKPLEDNMFFTLRMVQIPYALFVYRRLVITSISSDLMLNNTATIKFRHFCSANT